MTTLRVFLSRLAELFRKGARERDLADELESHLQLQIDDNLRAGMSPAEARRQARLRFGSVDAVKESQRERRGLPRLEALGRDLRYGTRLLVRAPGFTAVVVLSLAVGIGGNSAIFSVINALTLRPLPVPRPHELSQVITEDDSSNPAGTQLSYPVYQQLLAQLPAGARLGAMSRVMTRASGVADGGTGSVPTTVQLVSGEYFTALDLAPALGRFLGASDNRDPGAHPVVVLGHGFWQKHFAAAPDVVGRTVRINDLRFTVIGVAPAGFTGVWLESPAELFVPLAMQANLRYAQNYSSIDGDSTRPFLHQSKIRWLEVILRTDGEHRPQALAALRQVYAQTQAADAGRMNDPQERRLALASRLGLQPFERGFSSLRRRFLSPLLVLMGMVSLLLLIACANTANLLLARASQRRREIALRLSIGATRRRLVQQLCTESLLLGLLGGALGLLLAPAVAELLVRMVTANSTGPLPFAVTPDRRVLLFTGVVCLATIVLFGLTPALRSTRLEIASTLRAGGRGIMSGAGSRPARLLVVGQVALSLVLVVVAGLFLRSLRALHTMDLGFDRQHLVSVVIGARGPGLAADERPSLARLVEQVEALPGVSSASGAQCGLVSGCRTTSGNLKITGYEPGPHENISVRTSRVGQRYFQTVGIPLVAGRDFDDRDREGGPQVAIVNEAFVRRYLPGTGAVGHRFGKGGPFIEIVGVVRDARTSSVQEAPMPTAFFPLAQAHGASAGTLEVRTTGDPGVLAASLGRVLAEREPRVVVERVRTLSEQVERNLVQERALARLTGVLGMLALGLACFGLYGLMAYAVAGRTTEIGIRTALGASSTRVLWMVLGESLRLVAVGLAVGLALVLVASRFLAGQLHGVGATDPPTVLLSALALVLVAALAAYLPARRASRVDPLIALRAE
jgi:predicted permease